jgi:hypothetical protein
VVGKARVGKVSPAGGTVPSRTPSWRVIEASPPQTNLLVTPPMVASLCSSSAAPQTSLSKVASRVRSAAVLRSSAEYCRVVLFW